MRMTLNMTNKGRLVTYHIIIKHRGELPKAYLDTLELHLWEYFGDIPKSDIRIIKVSNTQPK